jgi:hypothetical protein
MTEEQSWASEVPNNPAGRVLTFLRKYQALVGELDKTAPAMTALELMLTEKPESARMYLLVARLRTQAESVENLMESYSRYPAMGRTPGTTTGSSTRSSVSRRQLGNALKTFSSASTTADGQRSSSPTTCWASTATKYR